MLRPSPHTFSTKHLAALADAGKRLMATSPTRAKLDAFAASLSTQMPHVESATYNAELHRLEVRLVGGLVAFPIPLPEAPKPKLAEPAKPSVAKIEADIARDGGQAHANPDGSITATFAAAGG